MDQLREFLARVLPWPDEDQGHFCNIHWKKIGNDGRPYWDGRACRTVDDAVRTVKWVQGLADAQDVYVCMSAQRQAESVISKAGKPYLKAIRNQENAVALKALFVDMDVKEGAYADQKEALVALLSFCAEIDLPRPTLVVNSGGGVHAHWELDRPLAPAMWQPLADALSNAAHEKGLLFDAGVTIDSARILRPPQTKNFKFTPPKDTKLIGKAVEGAYSVERIERALKPFQVATPRGKPAHPDLGGVTGAVPAALAGVTDDGAAGLSTAKTVDLKVVAEACPWLKQSFADGGVANDNFLRRQIYLISQFTDDPRASAWELVRNRDTLKEGEFDEEMDRVARERVEKDFGWPSCATIMTGGCAHCRTCPHLKEGKSPLNLATKPAFVPAANPLALPRGYQTNADGHIFTVKTDELGASKIIVLMEYPVSNAWAQKDPWVLHFAAELQPGSKSKIELPAGAIMAKDTLVKALAEQGLMTEHWAHKHLQEFFVSWIKTLQTRKDSVVESSPFGWNTSNGVVDGFCFGGEVWTPTGSRPAPNVDHILRRQYAPTGDAQPWRDAIGLVVGRGRPELEVMVASAFAAPLVKATGWYGAFLSAYSQESGIGKTTALKIAQAVWGNPVTAMQGMDDTLNSVTHKIGSIRSLPLYWDEIKGDDATRKFVKLAFQLTSGKDKSRLGRDAALREVGQWQTMLVSATNESLVDMVALQTTGTTAGLYRLFEFEVAPPVGVRTVDTTDAQRLLGRLDDNYGVIGFEYARWLGQNFSRIDADVGECMKRLEKDWSFRQDERFWLCNITCVIMGATYANELGFATFDIPEITAFLRKTLLKMREGLKETHVDLTNPTNVVNVLSQFLKAMKRHTIWTNRVPKGRGRPKPGAFKVLKVHPQLDGVQVHIGKEDKIIRISSTHLTDWLGKHTTVSRNILMNEFKKRFGAEKVIGCLGSGTEYVEAKEYVIEINAAGTPLAAFIDEADDGVKRDDE